MPPLRVFAHISNKPHIPSTNPLPPNASARGKETGTPQPGASSTEHCLHSAARSRHARRHRSANRATYSQQRQRHVDGNIRAARARRSRFGNRTYHLAGTDRNRRRRRRRPPTAAPAPFVAAGASQSTSGGAFAERARSPPPRTSEHAAWAYMGIMRRCRKLRLSLAPLIHFVCERKCFCCCLGCLGTKSASVGVVQTQSKAALFASGECAASTERATLRQLSHRRRHRRRRGAITLSFIIMSVSLQHVRMRVPDMRCGKC